MQTDLKYFPKTVANSSFRIIHDKLDYEVISCMQAARAKDINIANELKTLILSTSKGYVALHICGDRQANLREIKTFLNCDQASLASPKDLGKMKLGPGKICPILEPTWGMHHLISRHVLSLKRVSTNDGTRKGYYTFNPRILLLTQRYELGTFSKIKS